MRRRQPKEKSLENAESLWQDKKLTHVPNYQYLPPVQGLGRQLRKFPKLQQPTPQTYDDVLRDLGGVLSSRNTSAGDPLDIHFTKTSKDNNLVCQIFEVTSGSMNKLRMIDFGEFEDSDPMSPGKHIFFAGK